MIKDSPYTVRCLTYILGDSKERVVLRELIEAALAEVRPGIMMDGGDVELVDVQDDEVFIRLTGACRGCPISTLTLKSGIEKTIVERVPSIKRVVAV